MVALHLLKHMDGLSDEAVCARYLDSPYVQAFCGEAHFKHTLPLDRSSMTRWPKRIGPERMEPCSPKRWRLPSGWDRGGETRRAGHHRHHSPAEDGNASDPAANCCTRVSERLAHMARWHGLQSHQIA